MTGDSLHPSIAFTADPFLGIRYGGPGAGSMNFVHNNDDQYVFDDTKFDTKSKPIDCGQVNCSSLVSSSSVTSNTTNTGNIFCADVLASGDINCATVFATGDITCPRYNLKVTRSSTQSISNNVVTDVIFTIKSSGNNISFTNPQAIFTIPVNGYYILNGWCEWQSNDTGLRTIYFRITGTDYNPNAIPPVTWMCIYWSSCCW
jgi:hypothetical protein